MPFTLVPKSITDIPERRHGDLQEVYGHPVWYPVKSETLDADTSVWEIPLDILNYKVLRLYFQISASVSTDLNVRYDDESSGYYYAYIVNDYGTFNYGKGSNTAQIPVGRASTAMGMYSWQGLMYNSSTTPSFWFSNEEGARLRYVTAHLALKRLSEKLVFFPSSGNLKKGSWIFIEGKK